MTEKPPMHFSSEEPKANHQKMERFFKLFLSETCLKGAGVFGRPGQNMEDLFVFGTSRSSNELKSVPQPPCQLRLMKRYFWSHKICHLWLKIGLFLSHVWPI